MTPFESYLDHNPFVAILFFFFYTWFIAVSLKALILAIRGQPTSPEALMTPAEKIQWQTFKRVSDQIAASKENQEAKTSTK